MVACSAKSTRYRHQAALLQARRRLVRRGPYASPVPWDDDWGLDRFAAIEDAEELCRQLLASPGGWGSSTRHIEAVELLEQIGGTSELPGSFVVLMVCTCRRWDRVTAGLIAAIEDGRLLDAAGLDELAEAFLSHAHVISYPLSWVSPQWLEVELDSGAGHTCTVDEHTLAQHRPSFEPPLRRWAAQRVLRADPARLDDLLRSARAFEPRHRDALVHGLLDSAEGLEEACRRDLIRCGLESAQASVRRTALDRLCELGGPEVASRRARADTNAAVRRWRPRQEQLTAPSLLAS
jgi:hypothetical protein